MRTAVSKKTAGRKLVIRAAVMSALSAIAFVGLAVAPAQAGPMPPIGCPGQPICKEP
jgi:hypothetical protein